ncbi:MAG: hypothetical protein DYG90_03350 [Chloroflexi bacterium CFX6]|nr:hypothetical protein [Chloroflexi bacterium CFX6]
MTNSDVAGVLGLEDYQVTLLEQLAEQADERGIPREVLPVLAKYLDRVDFDRLVVNAAGAGEILGVGDRQVGNLTEQHYEWMAPLVTLRDRTGEIAFRLWLSAKVQRFAQMR